MSSPTLEDSTTRPLAAADAPAHDVRLGKPPLSPGKLARKLNASSDGAPGSATYVKISTPGSAVTVSLS